MSAEQQVSDTPSGGICIPSADSKEKIVCNTAQVMGCVTGYLTDGCRCNCECVRDAISPSSRSQDAETSRMSVQFAGNSVFAIQITNTCSACTHLEAPLLPYPVNELTLRNGQVAVGGNDLTGNEQRGSDDTPAACVSRSQGTVSLAQDKVSEEGNATKEPASVYTGRKDITGLRGSDSEPSSISVEGRIAVDNWVDADSCVVATGDFMQDHSMETRWGRDSPNLAVGVCTAPHMEDYAGQLMDKTQEISPRNVDEEWWFPYVDEDTRGTLDTQEEVCLGQEFSELTTASFVLACGYVTAATTGLEMEPVSLWNMVVESHDHRKVTVCTIDEIFRISEYSDAVQESQPSKVHKTGHVKHTEFPEGKESGATELSVSTSNPQALYSFSRWNNSEIPNVTTTLKPNWCEGALPTDPILGGEQKPDKNLLHGSPKANKLSSLNSRSMSQITLNKEGFREKFLKDSKVQTEDTEQIKFLSDKQSVSDSHRVSSLTFENEPLLSGDPLQVVTIDPKQNKSIHTVRELNQELSSLIILTGDRLMLSKESCIAYFILDLHVMSDYTASPCVVDVHRQMSLEKTKNICKTEDRERVRVAPSKSETHRDCEIVPRQQSGAEIANCLIKTWKAETRTTKQGEHPSSKPPLVPALLTESKEKETQSATVTVSAPTMERDVTRSWGEEKRKHSSTQTKSFHLSTANENLLNLFHTKDGLQTEIDKKDKSTVSHPVRNKREKVSGPVVHKRPYTEVGEDQLVIKEEVPRVLRDIWVERDEAASVGLKLQCLLGHITMDCTIIWSKDNTVLAEEKGSTGDVHRVSLCLAGGSKPDLGMYRCLLRSTHGQACSEHHLTLEALRELIPEQQNTEEVQGVREDVKCAPLLFKDDFLREQYFGNHEMASIITEGVHFGEGMHRRAFRTRLLEGMVTAFRPGQHCVLKVHSSPSCGTRGDEDLLCRNYSLAVEECYVQNTAREYIRAYREAAKAAETFGEVPDIIPIYLVYRPSNIIPYATLEEELIGDFVKYSVRDGREVNLMRRESEAGQKCCAFQHWVYHRTEGNLLVTDMQGVGMKLTDVGIATCRKGYQGFRGNCSTSFIDQFRALHQCNHFCGLLGLQALQSEQPKRTGNDPKLKPKTTTLSSVMKRYGSPE